MGSFADTCITSRCTECGATHVASGWNGRRAGAAEPIWLPWRRWEALPLAVETLHLASRTEITPEAAAGYAARLACIALASVQALTLQVRPWPRCRTPDCNAQNCVPVLKRGTGGCSQIHVLLKSLAWLFQLFYGMGREERGRGGAGVPTGPSLVAASRTLKTGSFRV